MNISHTDINDLNKIITITIDKRDYQDNLLKELKSKQKNTEIKGFRKGQVPMGLIKKQYELPLIYDIINNMISNELYNYITEKEFNLLGEPITILNEELDLLADSNNFEFEIGLEPNVDIDISEITLPYYNLQVHDDEINKAIEKLRVEYGKEIESNEIHENSLIYVDLIEKKEDGIKVENNLIYFDELKDTAKWLGKKTDEKFDINVQDIFSDPHLLEDVLNIPHKEIHEINSDFEVIIKEIKDIEKLEINQELFDAYFKDENITTEEEFREKIYIEFGETYKKHSDLLFIHSFNDEIIKHPSLTLPKDFLLKFLKYKSKKDIDEEELLKKYNKEELNLKYGLIEDYLLEKYNFTIDFDTIKEFRINEVKNLYKDYNFEISENDIEDIVLQSLKKEKEFKKIYNEIKNQELNSIILNNVKKEIKNVYTEEFIDIVEKITKKSDK